MCLYMYVYACTFMHVSDVYQGEQKIEQRTGGREKEEREREREREREKARDRGEQERNQGQIPSVAIFAYTLEI